MQSQQITKREETGTLLFTAFFLVPAASLSSIGVYGVLALVTKVLFA